jgi:hypothetical protein
VELTPAVAEAIGAEEASVKVDVTDGWCSNNEETYMKRPEEKAVTI